MQKTEKSIITSALARFAINKKILIFGSTILIIIISIIGIFKLEVKIALLIILINRQKFIKV